MPNKVTWITQPDSSPRKHRMDDLIITQVRSGKYDFVRLSFKKEIWELMDSDAYRVGFDFDNGVVYVAPDPYGYALNRARGNTRRNIRLIVQSCGDRISEVFGEYVYLSEENGVFVFEKR